MSEITVWGIHAGKTGDADELFKSSSVAALGWGDVGAVSKLAATREAFKDAVHKTYPAWSPGKLANAAGQLFRFSHEMKVGDLIAYPSKQDRHVHIGRVSGEIEYRPDLMKSYPQVRSMKWLKSVPRTSFSQGALYEMGSALSFFQIKSYADEIIAAIEGKEAKIASPAEDESVALVAEDIEEQTRDFVLKQLAKNLKGLPLELFVQHLLEKMGYKARLMRTNEPSVDLIAHKDELGFEPPIIKVQVKSTDGKVQDRDVSALYGKLGPGEHALMVTLGEYTPPAVSFANSKSNLRLINGDDLVALIFEHYEKFDSKYKSIVPLKMVYVPEPIETV